MKKKTRTQRKKDEPVGSLKRISDFLPPPDQLIKTQGQKKITLVLDEATVESFKSMAFEYGTKYQRMMREVLKGYAQKYGM